MLELLGSDTGQMAHKDDTEILLRETIQADLVVHLTENKFGTVTSLTKKAMDKAIPLGHPHIIVKNGKSEHKARYEKLPKWGFMVLDTGHNTEDFQRITKFFADGLENVIFHKLVSSTTINFDELTAIEL